ncbi:toxin-antitoxin system YwqK family antitoxin [Ulvibacterium marinum]|uniref:toxin-antitoxin system YwqK family antitoxin n=1 Tax=Ulvibacterium marinum TaxID=2419782 RepID=UPI001FEC013E|nr:hypothetical protein [Ulvibacterium marinum]
MLAKLVVLTSIFFIFGNATKTTSLYHKEYYETGEIKSEGWLENDEKTGYWKFYHSNGRLSEEGHYKNDKKEKYWYFYTKNNIRTKEGHYKNGKKAGWWLFYDQKGKIDHKCQLSNGKKNGYCLKYKNEKLTSAEKYKNGEKIKEWFDFSSFNRENKLSDLR